MRRLPGWIGWVVLGVWVAAWDVCPRTETMSTAFSPVGRHGKPTYLVIWIYLTLHLTRLIPDKFDPLRNIPVIHTKEV